MGFPAVAFGRTLDPMVRRLDLVRAARIVLFASVAVLLFFGSFSSRRWVDIAATVGTAVLFSALIGLPMQALLPTLAPRIFRTTRAPYTWMLLVAAMMGISAAGSAAGIVLLAAVGLLPWDGMFGFFVNALRISLAIALTFGVGITLYERMRHRADAADLALRVKERDEAEARRIATEARLASLESRVQPHFLFNTLNSIAALIPQDPAGAERMTGQLASLLRSSLDGAASPLVPLHQELRSVRDYLDIERVRFGDRLRFSITVPGEFGQVAVPRFALQTVVENSVKFAVSPRREGGAIEVAASSSGNDVRLTVTDDGPGFDAGAVPDHHGLALLRERLLLSFGDQAALEVSSRPGRTAVAVRVPR